MVVCMHVCLCKYINQSSTLFLFDRYSNRAILYYKREKMLFSAQLLVRRVATTTGKYDGKNNIPEECTE